MKKVIGGVAQKFSCQCTGSVGTWTANYSSAQQIIADIQDTCRSGEGTCTAAGS